MRKRDDNLNVLLEQPAMKKLLPDVMGKRVLDLGCGCGKNCRDFIERGAVSVVGVDLYEKMLAVAQKENRRDGITYLHMDMTMLSDISGTFDLIYSSLAFHYVENFPLFVSGLYDILSPGGVLLFSQEHPICHGGWQRALA